MENCLVVSDLVKVKPYITNDLQKQFQQVQKSSESDLIDLHSSTNALLLTAYSSKVAIALYLRGWARF